MLSRLQNFLPKALPFILLAAIIVVLATSISGCVSSTRREQENLQTAIELAHAYFQASVARLELMLEEDGRAPAHYVWGHYVHWNRYAEIHLISLELVELDIALRPFVHLSFIDNERLPRFANEILRLASNGSARFWLVLRVYQDILVELSCPVNPGMPNTYLTAMQLSEILCSNMWQVDFRGDFLGRVRLEEW